MNSKGNIRLYFGGAVVVLLTILIYFLTKPADFIQTQFEPFQVPLPQPISLVFIAVFTILAIAIWYAYQLK